MATEHLPSWIVRKLRRYQLDGRVHAAVVARDGTVLIDLALSTSQNLSKDIVPFTRAVGGSLQSITHTTPGTHRAVTPTAQLRVIIPPPRSWSALARLLLPHGIASLLTLCAWAWLNAHCKRSL